MYLPHIFIVSVLLECTVYVSVLLCVWIFEYWISKNDFLCYPSLEKICCEVCIATVQAKEKPDFSQCVFDAVLLFYLVIADN